MSYRSRTKLMVSASRHKQESTCKSTVVNVDELPLFPVIPFETSLCFFDNMESMEQKEKYVENIKDTIYTQNNLFDLDSTDYFDDSDADKDYNPSSSSESDIENNKRKRTLGQSKKIKKTPSTAKATVSKTSTESKKNDEVGTSFRKEAILSLPKDASLDMPTLNYSYVVTEVDENLNPKENISLSMLLLPGQEGKHLTSSNQDKDLENVPQRSSDISSNASELDANSNKNIPNKGKSKVLTKQQERSDRGKIKHPMRDPCLGKCKKNCQKLSEEQRRKIWNGYWTLDYTSRRKWLAKHVKLVPVKRKYVGAIRPRADSRIFTLPDSDHTEISVCRLTLLNTLGYTNDSVITELVHAMKQAPCGNLVKERRGSNPKRTIDKTRIVEHIESFHPCISHYRRKNAPNIRYLPRELTVKQMFEDFNTKHPNVCKIEFYRLVLKERNISLCQPKSDVCEECETLKNAIQTDNSNENIGEQLALHKLKAERATAEYKRDSEEAAANNNPQKRIYSMDLQKVILLPIMPSSKTCFFTSRLVLFNQTFATLNPNAIENSYCVVWHEAISGRKAEALVDASIKVIRKERDVSEFTFWADNCTSQNKNWVLYTSLVTEVNSDTGPNQITIRYLTTGHTHMSADGIHGNIEKKLKRKRNVYDFEELLEVIGSSRKKMEVLRLEEFHSWQNKKRTTKKTDDSMKGFTLNNLVEVRFEKGSNVLKYKTDFTQDYKELNFLQKKYNTSTTFYKPQALGVRGISTTKKQNIIKQLVPLMPLNRQQFWKSLADSETSSDLVDSGQVLLEDENL